MFDYGKIYSRISAENFKELDLGFSWSPLKLLLARQYLALVGYPDVASQMRYRLVTNLLKLKPNNKVLDAGCGNGIYVHEYTDRFKVKCVGVDGRKERVELARKINDILGFDNTFRTFLLENLNLSKEQFDVILCLEVLEHIEDDGKALKKMKQYLKKGGMIVITIPKKGTALSHEDEEDPNFVPEPFEHVRSGYDVQDLENLAKEAGFKKVEIRPYFFFFAKNLVKIQQKLYKKHMIVLNLLLSPFLTLVAMLDFLIPFAPRGYVVVLKNETR